MANPKRRHSNTRTRLRRTHDCLHVSSMTNCGNCGRLIMPHRICTFCGHYRGRQVVTITSAAKKKEGSSQ